MEFQQNTLNAPELFELIRLENTEKGKIALLQQSDEFAKFVLKQTYDTMIKYGIKQIPEYTPNTETLLNNTQESLIIAVLKKIEDGTVRGNEAVNAVQDTLSTLDEGYGDILVGILVCNQYIDVGRKILNRAFNKNFIFVAPYMRCMTQEKGLERITFPAKIDLKLDGAFMNAIIHPQKDQVIFMTRNGNTIELPLVEQKILQTLKDKDITRSIVLNGEMMMKEASAENRSDGNGLINSLIAKEGTLETFERKISEAKTEKAKEKLENDLKKKLAEWKLTEERAYLVCWDLIEYDNWINGYEEVIMIDRFNKLTSIFETSDAIGIAENKIVNSVEEAMEFFDEQRNKGLEGAVLKQITPTKQLTTYYKNHTSPSQTKLKGLYVIEMKCIDFSYSDENTPFSGFIGNLVCETSCGKFKAKISGLDYKGKGILVDDKGKAILNEGAFTLTEDAEDINDFFVENYLNKVVSVQFNDITIDKKGNYSLQFAQFKGIRNDKDTYDTLEYILDMTGK